MLLNATHQMWSTLAPAGQDAIDIARVFWIMAIGGGVIWSVVAALLLHAHRRHRGRWSDGAGIRLIVMGGVAIPVVVLAALLLSGLPVLSQQLAPAPADAWRVHVSGEQWWWRIRYEQRDGSFVELANELRLPRGQAAEVMLTSTDVIHSFWVPSLAGKVDMVPGRINRLTLEPLQAGTYRGVCAEYCGDSHARMSFVVQVVEPEEFISWLGAQASQAAVRALPLFTTAGCAACHAIRGTGATSTIGPDLTHVGSRLTIGAGTLPNTHDNLARWIANPHAVKPGALMPPFSGLPPGDVRALANYLRELR